MRAPVNTMRYLGMSLSRGDVPISGFAHPHAKCFRDLIPGTRKSAKNERDGYSAAKVDATLMEINGRRSPGNSFLPGVSLIRKRTETAVGIPRYDGINFGLWVGLLTG